MSALKLFYGFFKFHSAHNLKNNKLVYKNILWQRERKTQTKQLLISVRVSA